MANVNDILRQAGIDEQQITNLGPKILDALGNVLTEANQARDQAARPTSSFINRKLCPASTDGPTKKQGSMPNWDGTEHKRPA